MKEGEKVDKLYEPEITTPKEIAQREHILKMSEISLWLDDYDDIFSDFDSRPYEYRALSDDFLQEAKRASLDKPSGNLGLNLMVPSNQRDVKKEKLIKKRLKEHFEKHHKIARRELGSKRKLGLYFVIAGIIVMFVAALILFKSGENHLFLSFLVILLEPAGWFLFWEGMNQTIFEWRSVLPLVKFYEKMSNCDIDFLSY